MMFANHIWNASSEKVPPSMRKLRRLRSAYTKIIIKAFAFHSYMYILGDYLLADSEGPDQPAWMRRLIRAFAVCICPGTCFRMARPIYKLE